MGVDRDSIPDNYLCEKCDARPVDKHMAVSIQRRKRQEIPGRTRKVGGKCIDFNIGMLHTLNSFKLS